MIECDGNHKECDDSEVKLYRVTDPAYGRDFGVCGYHYCDVHADIDRAQGFNLEEIKKPTGGADGE